MRAKYFSAMLRAVKRPACIPACKSATVVSASSKSSDFNAKERVSAAALAASPLSTKCRLVSMGTNIHPRAMGGHPKVRVRSARAGHLAAVSFNEERTNESPCDRRRDGGCADRCRLWLQHGSQEWPDGRAQCTNRGGRE